MTPLWKIQLFWLFILFFGACSHLGSTSSDKTAFFVSQAARVNSELARSMEISSPKGHHVDQTYMQIQADYHFTLAESYSLQDRPLKAVEHYQLALIYDQNSPQIRYRMALEFVKLGFITKALEECRRVLELDPKHKDSSLLLGGLLSAMHIFDEALAVYRKALVHYPNDPEISLFIGVLYGEKGDFKKSIKHLQKLAQSRKVKIKDKAQIWYYLGRIYASSPKPNLKKAQKAYITSLEMKPEAIHVVFALGSLYQLQGEKVKLEKLYSDYQQKRSGDADPAIAEKLAQIYIDGEQFDKALPQLRILESYESENFNISLKIALILVEQKKYKEAIKKLKSILKKHPESEKVRFYLGSLYEEIGDYRAAIEHFEGIPVASQYYEDSVIHASYLHKLLGDWDAAVTKIKQGLVQKQEAYKFWLFHASLLRENNQLSEAGKVLNFAVKLFPKNKQIHFQLGSIYDRLGKTDKTILHMEKVLEIDDNNVQALNYLAYIYANDNRNLATAERLVRKALKLQPEDGFIMDTLGWVLFKQDRIQEAVRFLEKAHGKNASESIIAEHLGDAYFHYQLLFKAKSMYKKAAKLEKNSTNKAKILSKLQSVEQKLRAQNRQRGLQTKNQRERLPSNLTK